MCPLYTPAANEMLISFVLADGAIIGLDGGGFSGKISTSGTTLYPRNSYSLAVNKNPRILFTKFYNSFLLVYFEIYNKTRINLSLTIFKQYAKKDVWGTRTFSFSYRSIIDKNSWNYIDSLIQNVRITLSLSILKTHADFSSK